MIKHEKWCQTFSPFSLNDLRNYMFFECICTSLDCMQSVCCVTDADVCVYHILTTFYQKFTVQTHSLVWLESLFSFGSVHLKPTNFSAFGNVMCAKLVLFEIPFSYLWTKGKWTKFGLSCILSFQFWRKSFWDWI